MSLVSPCSGESIVLHYLLMWRRAAQRRCCSSCHVLAPWVKQKSWLTITLQGPGQSCVTLWQAGPKAQFSRQFLKTTPLASASKLLENLGLNEWLFCRIQNENLIKQRFHMRALSSNKDTHKRMAGNDLQLVDMGRNWLHKVFPFSDLFVNFNLPIFLPKKLSDAWVPFSWMERLIPDSRRISCRG